MDKTKLISARRSALLDYLRSCFVPGVYISIMDICTNVVIHDPDTDEDFHPYKFNFNPYIHDHCAVLGSDIRAIDWGALNGTHEIIIRDSRGYVKLCESMEEFIQWRDRELVPLVKKYKFLSTLKNRAKLDGTVPMFTFDSDSVVDNDDPIVVFPEGYEFKGGISK